MNAIVDFSVELDTHVFHIGTNVVTSNSLVFTNTTGKYQYIHATHGSCVSTNIFLDTVVIHIHCHLGSFVTFIGSLGKFAHIGRNTRQTHDTTLLVQDIAGILSAPAFFFHQESNSTGIDVTRTGTHQQTFQRSQTHGSIDTLTILDSCNRTTVTDMSRDNFGSIVVETQDIASAF